MSRLTKIIISIVYLSLYKISEMFSIMLKVHRRPCVVNLYYHSIKGDEVNCFKKQIDYIRESGEVITSSAEYPMNGDKHYIVITFDDGFTNFMTNALPILIENKIPVTVFVPTGFIGKSQGWIDQEFHENFDENIMTATHLLNLPKDLVMVESHSVSHCRLGELDEKRVLKEISDSKITLEELLGCEISQLSFPYGSYSENTLELARKVGYERVFSNLPRNIKDSEDSFLWGRVPISPKDWDVEYKLKVKGGYQWLSTGVRLKNRLRKLGL